MKILCCIFHRKKASHQYVFEYVQSDGFCVIVFCCIFHTQVVNKRESWTSGAVASRDRKWAWPEGVCLMTSSSWVELFCADCWVVGFLLLLFFNFYVLWMATPIFCFNWMATLSFSFGIGLGFFWKIFSQKNTSCMT